MLSSDWSSDVCSSDLHPVVDVGFELLEVGLEALGQVPGREVVGFLITPGVARVQDLGRHVGAALRHQQTELRVLGDADAAEPPTERSEGRRGGKEGVSTCRSWWSPYQ